MSKADVIFKDMCERILSGGHSSEGSVVRARWEDGTPAHTIKSFGVVNRYDLAKEFPALTLRPVPFRNCVDELLWIWQKKSNKIAELTSHIWDSWADDSGTIGKAYGYQLGVEYDFGGGRVMDQVDNVLWQLENTPSSRRIMTNLYNFADLPEMGLEPCAYSMTFNVTGAVARHAGRGVAGGEGGKSDVGAAGVSGDGAANGICGADSQSRGGSAVVAGGGVKPRGRLNAILNQRSQDVLTANAWNVCQYAVLVHMIAQVSGLEAGEFLHVISDAHIYDKHVPLVRELIARPEHPAPKFVIDKSVTNFYDFTPDSVRLEDYECGEQIKGIPVAV